ncbi:hypothetical protein KSS87_002596 [Heliosperma pusillum]|nr:hypothetical protein KSS87_002596 [Heliosperma pusillum]
MPPVRKKVATNNNNGNFNSKINSFTDQVQSVVTGFKLDDLVLAKVKGFPAWPAKRITGIECFVVVVVGGGESELDVLFVVVAAAAAHLVI